MDQYNIPRLPPDTAEYYYEVSWLGTGQVGRGDAGLTKLPGSLIVCVFRSIRQVLDYNVNLSLTTSLHHLPSAENNDGNQICFSFRICGRFLWFNLKILRSEIKTDLQRRLSSKHSTCIPVSQRRSDSDFPNCKYCSDNTVDDSTVSMMTSLL